MYTHTGRQETAALCCVVCKRNDTSAKTVNYDLNVAHDLFQNRWHDVINVMCV